MEGRCVKETGGNAAAVFETIQLVFGECAEEGGDGVYETAGFCQELLLLCGEGS